MALAAGTILGQFEIRCAIGAGGMGEVYRAHDTRLDREVAIKVLPESLVTDRDRLRRFEQEARAAAALNHPNILAVFQMATHDGVSYMVTEFLDGETLRDCLRHGPMPLRKAIAYALQIAQGLAAAHEKGIVHRDLKPENLFVAKDGRVKILDFGLAKFTTPQAVSENAVTITLHQPTEPGMLIGTVGYMSPEQVRGQPADKCSDIFAFGSILYEMVTGKQTFRKPTSAETIGAILHEEPPSLSQLAPATPPALQRVVHRCLEKNPEQRFHSAHDLAFALEVTSDSAIPSSTSADPHQGGAIPGEGAATSESGHGAVVDKPLRKQQPWLWVLGVTALALLTFGGFMVWRAEHRTPRLASEQQVTANPSEAPIVAAVISPDGKYVAYSDTTGIYIRQVDTGETRPLPLPRGLDAVPTSWFPDGTHLVLSSGEALPIVGRINPQGVPSLWKVSLLGGDPQKLMENASGGVVSPDGSRIEFLRGDAVGPREVWVMGSDESDVRRVSGPAAPGVFIYSAAWAPDGSHIAYIRHFWPSYSQFSNGRYALETVDSSGGAPKTLMTSTRFLSGICWSADGRLLYGYQDEQARELPDYGVWSVRVNEKTGQSAGEPVQITKGVGRVGGLSITADGKRMLLWRDNLQPTVSLSEIDSATREFKTPRRLTYDENTNMVTAWTPDSRAVVFTSNRNGTFKLFCQPIDQAVPEVLVEGRSIFQPRLSPDGTEIFYLAGYNPEDPTHPVRLMAVPVGGGAPRVLLQTPLIGDIQCARSPSQRCLLVSNAPPSPRVFSFDPKDGRMQPFSPLADITFENWGLSPDGSQIALVYGRHAHKITFVRLNDATKREVGLNGFIQGMDWASDSKSVIVTSLAANGASEVTGVEPGGQRRVLLKHDHGEWYLYAIPSPDGRYAALMVLTGQNNVWMVESF